MHSQSDYRLVVRSDGESLLLTVEGAVGPLAGRHVREVTAAAARLGIPVRIDVNATPSQAEMNPARTRRAM